MGKLLETGKEQLIILILGEDIWHLVRKREHRCTRNSPWFKGERIPHTYGFVLRSNISLLFPTFIKFICENMAWVPAYWF